MADTKDPPGKDQTPAAAPQPEPKPELKPKSEREIGGPKGPEPTRYGDWETNGRCTDF